MIGQTDDTLDRFKMLTITSREARAGRMREDDELHKLSVETVQKMREPSPIKPSGGLGTKLRSWFK